MMPRLLMDIAVSNGSIVVRRSDLGSAFPESPDMPAATFCNIDEDEVTLAVEAGRAVLEGANVDPSRIRKLVAESDTGIGWGPIARVALGLRNAEVVETADLPRKAYSPPQEDYAEPGVVLRLFSNAVRPPLVMPTTAPAATQAGSGAGFSVSVGPARRPSGVPPMRCEASAFVYGEAGTDPAPSAPSSENVSMRNFETTSHRRFARAAELRADRWGLIDAARFGRIAVATVVQNVPMGANVSRAAWDASLEARYQLLASVCDSCKLGSHPPLNPCPVCGNATRTVSLWKPGQLHTWTIVAAGAGPSEFDPWQEVWGEYGVAVAEFEHGIRIAGMIVDTDLKSLKVGATLEPVFRRLYSQDGAWRYGIKFRAPAPM